MTVTTLNQKLIDTQLRIQQSTRRATLRASYVPSPDFDPPPTFQRQALPEAPQFVAAVWQPPVESGGVATVTGPSRQRFPQAA